MKTSIYATSKIMHIITLASLMLMTACAPEKKPIIAEDEIQALNKAKETAAAMEQMAQEQKDKIDEQAQ